MRVYLAQSVDREGRRLRQISWGGDASEIRSAVRRKGWVPIRVTALRPPRPLSPRTRLKPGIGLAVAEQLAMLLEAQVPLDSAMIEVLRQCPDSRGQRMLAEIHRALCADGRVAASFGLFPVQFPPHLQQLIEVGHRTGRLDRTFSEIARIWSEAEEVRRVVHRALIYPVIAGGLVTAVVVFLLGYVLPLFDRVYRDLGVTLPPLTRGLLRFSSELRSHPVPLAGVVLLLALAIFTAWRRPRAKLRVDAALSRLPVVRNLIQAVAVARISGLLSGLLRAGLSVQDGFALCERGTGNGFYDEAMRTAGIAMRGGRQLSDALEGTDRFPAEAIATLRIGEQTNRLTDALERVRIYSARRATDLVQRLLQLLEPLLTVGLGLCVGTVAVALFHPLVMLAMNIRR